MKSSSKVILSNFIFFLIFAIGFVYIVEYYHINTAAMRQDMQIIDNNMKMYLERWNGTYNGTKILGIYKGDYMMVWLKDRKYEEVMETCNHEWLHYRDIRGDWDENHFDPKYR